MTHGSIPLITGEGILGTFGWQEIDPRGEMWKWTRIVATAARARSLTENEWKSLGYKGHNRFCKMYFGFCACSCLNVAPFLEVVEHSADNANGRL